MKTEDQPTSESKGAATAQTIPAAPISHTYVVHEHAKKLPEMARHFDLTCVTVSPKAYGTTYGIEGERFGGWKAHDGYTFVVLPARGRISSVTKFILKGLTKVIRSRPWDYVLVENEPWSLLKWRTCCSARSVGPCGLLWRVHLGESEASGT